MEGGGEDAMKSMQMIQETVISLQRCNTNVYGYHHAQALCRKDRFQAWQGSGYRSHRPTLCGEKF